MADKPVIVWFRHDLRLSDNPALYQAARTGAPVIPVYIWAPEDEAPWAPGAASRVWLHASLSALQESLEPHNSRLVLRRGASALTELQDLIQSSGARKVYFNRRHEPDQRLRDEKIEQRLVAQGIEAAVFNASTLIEPEGLLNRQDAPYQVFTPFQAAAEPYLEIRNPLPRPEQLCPPRKWPRSDTLASLDLLPRVDWAGGIRRAWRPGEAQARHLLDAFLHDALFSYSGKRDFPAAGGASRLSPYLHFGEIGPRQVMHEVRQFGYGTEHEGEAEAFIRQLLWREFAYYVLHHFPHTSERPLNEKFAAFPWREDAALLEAWQRGRTGYPIVDAGMRELWETGWMHNRVRMVTASFLTKDLLQPWQAGARWFWDTLVDADLASNTLGWQWCAGCGADAAPYFRIFNPVSQGEKFDPAGEYVRKWVPELAMVPDKWLHQPWTAPGAVLEQAGVELGKDYPMPIVDHAEARERALGAYESLN